MEKRVRAVLWAFPKFGQTGGSMNVLPKEKIRVQAENNGASMKYALTGPGSSRRCIDDETVHHRSIMCSKYA